LSDDEHRQNRTTRKTRSPASDHREVGRRPGPNRIPPEDNQPEGGTAANPPTNTLCIEETGTSMKPEVKIEQREQPDTKVTFNRNEAELLAQLCQAVGYLSTIAEDCEAWLNNQCDETACEFIKAVRDYAKKGINA
jgi:hypothetical protein